MVKVAKYRFRPHAEAFRVWARREYAANLDYDWDSIARLDAVLAECHMELRSMDADHAWRTLVEYGQGAGAYFGEILVRYCGGSWSMMRRPDGGEEWYVRVPGHDRKHAGLDFHPFRWVREFLTTGPQVSLLSHVAPHMDAWEQPSRSVVAAKPHPRRR